MTVVVAVESPGGVLVGCDAFVGNADSRDVTVAPKWWRRAGLLIAYAGDILVPQVAACAPARFRRRVLESDADFVTRYARALREIHRERRVSFGQTDYLIAYRDGAYLVQSDATVVRSAHGYAAIGAGEDFALGSLATSEGRPPMARVTAALEAAERHATQVARPWRFAALSAPQDPSPPTAGLSCP